MYVCRFVMYICMHVHVTLVCMYVRVYAYIYTYISMQPALRGLFICGFVYVCRFVMYI